MSPDHRTHRGPHPVDHRLFAPETVPVLRQATAELSWLLGRGYAIRSSLKLVGDRHELTERQRLAITRVSAPDHAVERRRSSSVPAAALRGADVVVDGFNVLISTEAALGGGVLLVGRDGCIRDLASVHGSYRCVEETDRALRLIGETLATLAPASVRWLLDRPVSNSGRLARRIEELSRGRGWRWRVEVTLNPDRALMESGAIVVTTDSGVLDHVQHWFHLVERVVVELVEEAWLIDLRTTEGG